MKNCPLCKKVLYSELGSGCKMCGMHLDILNGDFCSETCEIKFNKINSGGKK